MPATPRTEKGRRTREQLLQAAGVVFARDGFVGTRMVDIADEASVSNGALYRYYGDKTDVFAAMISDLYKDLFQEVPEIGQMSAVEAWSVLAALNRAYIEHYAENGDVIRAFVEAGAVEERFHTLLWDVHTRHVNHSVALTRQITGASNVAGVSIETATEAGVCMVEQACYVWFAQPALGTSASVEAVVAITEHVWRSSICGAVLV